MSETLEPCPLCGSDWHWNASIYPAGMVYARCNGNDCNCAVYGTDQQQVIDRINRRTPGPATAKLLAWHRGEIRLTPRQIVGMFAAFDAEHGPAKPEAD